MCGRDSGEVCGLVPARLLVASAALPHQDFAEFLMAADKMGLDRMLGRGQGEVNT
jgi:hypothetical protein